MRTSTPGRGSVLPHKMPYGRYQLPWHKRDNGQPLIYRWRTSPSVAKDGGKNAIHSRIIIKCQLIR